MMTGQDLSRLEQQLGRLLRIGIALSGCALGLGLVLSVIGVAAGTTLIRAGLVLLMAIPITRIVASFVDAVRRHDHLLTWSTAFVLSVMLATWLYSRSAP